jgi:hypothetical protein
MPRTSTTTRLRSVLPIEPTIETAVPENNLGPVQDAESLIAHAIAAYYKDVAGWWSARHEYITAPAICATIIDHYGPSSVFDFGGPEREKKWVRWVLLHWAPLPVRPSSPVIDLLARNHPQIAAVNTADMDDHRHVVLAGGTSYEYYWEMEAAEHFLEKLQASAGEPIVGPLTAQDQIELLAKYGLTPAAELITTKEAWARQDAADQAAEELRQRELWVRHALKLQNLSLKKSGRNGYRLVRQSPALPLDELEALLEPGHDVWQRRTRLLASDELPARPLSSVQDGLRLEVS